MGLPYLCNALITFPVVLISVLIFDKWYSGDSASVVIYKIGFHKTSLKNCLPGIFAAVSLLLMYPAMSLIFGFSIYLSDNWFMNLCGLFLTGGLAEEMFFRGFLFRHLRKNMSFKKAGITSMFLFSAIHLLLFAYMDFYIALFSTMLAIAISIPMSYFFERADNTVWSAAIVHTVIRTIGLVVTVKEEDFMKFTLFWMICCMIIPLLIIILNKNFRNAWKLKN